MSERKVREISGKIELSDGTESEFSFTSLGWQQWGATTERLGATVEVLEAIQYGLVDEAIEMEDE